MRTLDPLDRLIAVLGRLPGVGRRSAERIALKLIRDRGTLVEDLLGALTDAEAKLQPCSHCGSVTLKTEDPCSMCRDPRRDAALLCVVEDPGDILILERAGEFRGRYHALMGKISPMRGEGVENIRVESLLKRVKSEGIREVILALNSDVESDATTSYLRDALAASGVKVTRLAFGIPAGSEIAYSDPVTLSQAIRGRQVL